MGTPVNLRTGKPGNGKTLNAIKEIDAQAKSEGRIVYYHNIRGLKSDKLQAQWFEFEDPLKWFELPDNSIVVIDEAQDVGFRGRDPRKPMPDFLGRLETIRHSGIEIHFITQDPTFVDIHIRKLAGSHVHYRRVFSTQRVMRLEWGEATDISRKGNFKDASTTVVKLDKKIFGLYDSTKMGAKHHFKLKLPTAVYLLLAVLVFLGWKGYGWYGKYKEHTVSVTGEQAQVQPGQEPLSAEGLIKSAVGAVTPNAPGQTGDKDRTLTRHEWLEARKPRLESLPSSAPVYDELTKPVSFPRTYCVSTVNVALIERNQKRMKVSQHNGRMTGCGCYTQQGTLVNSVSFEFCMNAVENGYFDPTIPDRQSQQAPMNSPAMPQMTQAAYTPPQQPQGVSFTVVPDSSRSR